MKIRIHRSVIEKAGYPPKHRIWKLLGDKEEIVVEAEKISVWKIPEYGTILEKQAEMCELDFVRYKNDVPLVPRARLSGWIRARFSPYHTRSKHKLS